MKNRPQTTKNKLVNNPVERFLIWLSTADSEVLAQCPKWERLKYAAFGASLLVPFLFGMIAASYAVSTLTSKVFIIAGFALIWGFIIITIDRALLATYRAFVPAKRKFGQFCLRMLVAVLMGMTVSHPLTLLLFKDTIHSEVERNRMDEMKKVRESIAQEKLDLDLKIQAAAENLQQQQQVYQDTLGGAFLKKNNQPTVTQLVTDYQSNKQQFADLDARIQDYRNDRDRIQSEYNQWVNTYEDEVSGRRTGRAGIGPAARAIENDELIWRRKEIKRLSQSLADLTQQRTQMSTALTASQSKANAQIAASRQQVEQQNLSLFKEQQGQMLDVAKSQIDAASTELERLRSEAAQLTAITQNHLDQVESESRADLMTQTLALHHLFEKPGGGFALSVYLVLAGLFVLIDTIPLVVKFFAVPGLYDERLELKERTTSGEKWNEIQRMSELAKICDLSEINEETYETLTRKSDLIQSLIDYQPKAVDTSEVADTDDVQSRIVVETAVKKSVHDADQQQIETPQPSRSVDLPVELPPTKPLPSQEQFQSLRNRGPQVVFEDEDDAIEFVPTVPVQQPQYSTVTQTVPVSQQQPSFDDNEIFYTGPDVDDVEMKFDESGFGELLIEKPEERQRIMSQLQAN